MKSNLKKIFATLLCLTLAVTLFTGCGDDETVYETTDTEGTSDSSSSNETSSTAITEGFTTEYTATDTVEIDIKDYGVITVELDATKAPITVANFKKLVNSGFYDGLTFHRIMKDFMMQGGDPKGNGTGGSDENIKGEFKKNGVDNNLAHIRGAISMARSSLYDSGTSQFFIVHKDSSFLDGNYACFGYVISGMDVVDKVCESAEPTDSNGTIPAAQQPIINKITIK